MVSSRLRVVHDMGSYSPHKGLGFEENIYLVHVVFTLLTMVRLHGNDARMAFLKLDARKSRCDQVDKDIHILVWHILRV